MRTFVPKCTYLRFPLNGLDFAKLCSLFDWRLGLGACIIALGALCHPALGDSTPSGNGGSGSYLYQWAPSPSSNPAAIDYGYVEQADGHLHLEIPIGEPRHNRAGNGTTQVRLVYDSNFWYPNLVGANYYWYPGSSWHLLPNSQGWDAYGDPNNQYFKATDAYGVLHAFPCRSGCYSVDGEGYWLDAWGVYDPSGSLVVNESDTLSYQTRIFDPDGNYIWLEGGTLPPVYGESPGLEYFDTSNIPFFYYYTSPFLGQSLTDPGPYEDDYYYAPNMSSAGASAEYLVHQVQIQVSTAFNEQRVWVGECPNSAGDNPCLAQVISQIVLPDNTSFTFKYDCDSTIAAQQAYCSSPGGQPAYYGGLTEMITPAGGTYTYSYKPFFDAYQDASLGLYSRNNGYGTWYYSQSAVGPTCGPDDVGCELQVTTVEPNGRTTVVTNAIYTSTVSPYPISELVTDGAGHNLSLTQTQWDTSHSDGQIHYGAKWVHKQWETVTEWDSTGAAQTRKTVYTYDSPQTGNVTELQEWGYYPGTSPTYSSIADRTTYTQYYTAANSPIMDSAMGFALGGINVINKPTSIAVCNNVGSDSGCPGGGSRVSQQLISYDQYGSSGPTSVTGVANHDDQAYGNTQLVRGNPTSVQKWISYGQYVSSSTSFDTTGQITSATDGNGNLTQYSYADNYYVDNGTSSPSTYAPAAPTHAFVTSITLPAVHGHSFTQTNGYYYGDQKPAFQTDVNGNSTYYHYSDPLDRVTQIVYPLGWTLTQYTSPTQTDVYRALSDTTPSTGCTGCLHTTTKKDGLERVIQTIGADGSKVDITYNPMGLVQSVSNPYQSFSDPTYGLTSYAYDSLDRVCMQNNPDNGSQSATCSLKGSSAQQFTYVVNGGYRTDENGHTWGYLYDPLGRLASVTEPDGATSQYAYDVLGNLQSVSQPSRPRSFIYDGLSRLVTATNPESGTVCYGSWNGSNCSGAYDGDGNLLSKTDARGVVTSYTYDSWNRLTSKTYSDGMTPTSCYQYDGSGIADGIGRLTNAWTQPAGTNCTGDPQSGFTPVSGQYLTLKSITAYDQMGRPTSEQECTPSNCTSATPYTLGYSYDLAGNLTSITNSAVIVPGGTTPLTLAYGYDNAGRQYNLLSNWQDTTHPATLFNATTFYPQGSWKNATYGANLNLNRTYDSRFRIAGESDTSNSSPATAGSALITITGAEGSQ